MLLCTQDLDYPAKLIHPKKNAQATPDAKPGLAEEAKALLSNGDGNNNSAEEQVSTPQHHRYSRMCC